jgi:hypothetical protein
MKNSALKISLVLFVVGLLALPMASSAKPLPCSQCDCFSDCAQSCHPGTPIILFPHFCAMYVCRDLCIARTTQVGTEDPLETFLAKLQAEAPIEEAVPTAADRGRVCRARR